MNLVWSQASFFGGVLLLAEDRRPMTIAGVCRRPRRNEAPLCQR